MSHLVSAVDSRRPISYQKIDPGKGPFAFLCDKILDFGKTLAVVLGYLTLVLPVVAYFSGKKKEQKLPRLIEKDPPRTEKDPLKGVLTDQLIAYIAKARGIIKEKGGIDPQERKEMNRELDSQLIDSFKKNGGKVIISGIAHPIFKEIMKVNMQEDLRGARQKNETREILLAYGYEEDEISDFISYRAPFAKSSDDLPFSPV